MDRPHLAGRKPHSYLPHFAGRKPHSYLPHFTGRKPQSYLQHLAGRKPQSYLPQFAAPAKQLYQRLKSPTRSPRDCVNQIHRRPFVPQSCLDYNNGLYRCTPQIHTGRSSLFVYIPSNSPKRCGVKCQAIRRPVDPYLCGGSVLGVYRRVPGCALLCGARRETLGPCPAWLDAGQDVFVATHCCTIDFLSRRA